MGTAAHSAAPAVVASRNVTGGMRVIPASGGATSANPGMNFATSREAPPQRSIATSIRRAVSAGTEKKR